MLIFPRISGVCRAHTADRSTYDNSELANINLDVEVFNSCDIDEIYSRLTNILNSTLNKHVPKKVVTRRPRDKVFMNS